MNESRPGKDSEAQPKVENPVQEIKPGKLWWKLTDDTKIEYLADDDLGGIRVKKVDTRIHFPDATFLNPSLVEFARFRAAVKRDFPNTLYAENAKKAFREALDERDSDRQEAIGIELETEGVKRKDFEDAIS